MSLVAASLSALAWLGRQGTRAVAAVLFIGIAVPPLGALLRPFVTEAVFLLLAIAFARVELRVLRGRLARPGLLLAATGWTTLAVPLLVGLICLAVGLDERAPELFLALMLQAMASPMMAAPAFAALMGLDATLVLMALVCGTALLPLTAPLFALIFVGPGLSLAPLLLGLKLFAILAGAALLAAVVRRIVGLAAIERRAAEIDGVNIIILFVFVAAVMQDAAASFFAAPLLVAGLVALAFGVFFALLGLTTLVFARAGRRHALALGFMASQRNMGLMLAATGGAVPDLTWLYVAFSQFPIYLSPHLLKPLARRLLGRGP